MMDATVPVRMLRCNNDAQPDDETGTPQMQDVEDAAYRIGHTYPGRVPALAARMCVNADTLFKKLNPNCETHRLSLADAVHLQLVANRCDVLYAMASQLDHICLPMPQGGDDDVSMRLAVIGAEVGDVFRVAQEALSDRKITAAERRRVSAQVAEAVGALAAFLRVL